MGNKPKAYAGLLIRTGANLTHGKGLDAALAPDPQPLFVNAASPELAVAGAPRWLATERAEEGRNPWDAAHELAERSESRLGVAPGSVYVEPDLLQQFYGLESQVTSFALPLRNKVADPQDETLPMGPGFAWHLGAAYSQLGPARALLPDDPLPVCIAHLDTGYDPAHRTRPVHLLAEWGWNFVENKRDATDPNLGGGLDNPCHGTATIGLLAGDSPGGRRPPLGGAWRAKILPLRVANSVVLFRTSAIAKAFDYLLRPTGPAGEEPPHVDVATLSMGGLPSAAWADAVNAAYEAGIVLVAAAGNNFSVYGGGVPTRFVVYPARFRRVLAACGIMANRAPYWGLDAGRMQGNFGPSSKMGTALSAFTPNVPWPEMGAPDVVDMDGSGTSCAAPQIAAAAALWIARYRRELDRLPDRWRKVEAVRQALFASADKSADDGSPEKLGNGILQAHRALSTAPAAQLAKTPPDTAHCGFLELFGADLGLAASPRAAMLAVEMAQLVQRGSGRGGPSPFESLLPDPDAPGPLGDAAKRRLLQALDDHPLASSALKSQLAKHAGKHPAPPAPGLPLTTASAFVPNAPPPPPYRRLRGYAFDPSLRERLETSPIAEVVFKIPWEQRLAPGPVGEYLEVIDCDPMTGCLYEPVDLNDPVLLGQDGLPPSTGNPKFHQQMVYAVASLTIRNFEAALGRKALWAPGPPREEKGGKQAKDDSHYVQRLRIHPHALLEPNAYFSPSKKALLLGYFRAQGNDPGDHVPGSLVFSCLSHDIVAHETAHALLDGMHRRYSDQTNPDVGAFHEAFADIVALLQHFTFPEILRDQIGKTRGELRAQASILGELALQFGRATGRRGALRSYIGEIQDGRWVPRAATAQDYENATELHGRGAVLVAAVFDAFLSIYERRTRDLLRIATSGTGVLPAGDLHPDLVNRLAEDAAKTANHVLNMCIRALDYCPPVDLTFGEYLRALITADRDLVRDDDLGYRVAFIEAFRRRGIFAPGVRTMSEESLAWRSAFEEQVKPSLHLAGAMGLLRGFAQRHVQARGREELFRVARETRIAIHDWLVAGFKAKQLGREDAELLGISAGRPDRFEVHSARLADRVGPDGSRLSQFVIELLHSQADVPVPGHPAKAKVAFEGGSTLLVDLATLQIRYVIRKRFDNEGRRARQYEFQSGNATLWQTYFGQEAKEWNEPFAIAHRS